jgi:hypothetical protein
VALSDSPMMKYRPTVRRRAANGKNRSWSDSQKIEAVQTYLILGSLKLTAGTLQIPHDTLKLWKRSEWWKTLQEELQLQEDLQLSNRLKKILSKSYDVVEDRLDNGDFVFDQKTGEMRRKPVNMKDAAQVATMVTHERRELIDRHLGEKTVTEDKIEKTLANLAKQFEEIASRVNVNKPSMEITEVIFGKEDPNAKETT